ncbi:MAG: tripartite tricarboxylate transporter substrate binding protein [Comamonadaceae bacterium]|nr:MAG: tripartite tricarboxylate transporter substrate binding protein [Comamonadaceae bacterium]
MGVRGFRLAASVLACVGWLASSVAAQAADSYPNRAVTMVVPQTPGGANDVIGRAIAQHLGQNLGQPVVVENKAGVGGNVGTAIAARAPNDGYTILLTAQSAHTINPALYPKIPFDPVNDFEPIMAVAVAPYMLVVNAAFPAKNLQELIDLAREKPGQINFASAGNGTVNHLLGEMLKKSTGIDIVHIPYRGAAPAATDVVGGQVPMTFGSFPGLLPFVRSGQLRALGVATETRTPLAPELPTLAETVPGLYANAWYGLFAPKGTPKAVIDRLQAGVVQVLQKPELQTAMQSQGLVIAPSTSDELATLLKSDLARWATIVKESGARAE